MQNNTLARQREKKSMTRDHDYQILDNPNSQIPGARYMQTESESNNTPDPSETVNIIADMEI